MYTTEASRGWRARQPPGVRFLDYAADHVLLQRVGGGYRFVHVLLRDYFADLNPQGPGIEDEA